MNTALLLHRLRWLHAPMGILMLLLQRTPVLRIVMQTEFAWERGAGDLLKSAFALAALGSYNSLAGATTFNVTSASGTAAVAAKATTTITGTVGTPINGATGVTMTVTGAPGTPKSYGVTDNATGTNYTNTLPPGLALNPLSGNTVGGAPYVNTTSSIKMILTGTPTTAGTYTVRFMASDALALGGGNTAYIVVSFSIGGGSSAVAPAFTTQPSSQTVTAGTGVTFTAAASGSPTPTYQWRKGGANIAGATSASYSIASCAAGDAGSYDVVATNSAGSATSNAATLTVNAASSAPAFTTQPSNQTVTVGTGVTFTAAASGSPTPTYQWRKGGANIAGATSASYSIASSAAGDAGSYDVVATNSAGSATSNAATLTVNAANTAPSITAQPQNVTTTAGSAASFSVTATGSPAPTYQWRKGGANIAGATASSYSIASVATGDAGSYDVVVTNSAGSVTSTAATLTVSASTVAPTISTQPASQTVTAGSAASFSVSANGTSPFTYQWKKGGANIAGATSATYSIASVAAGDAGDYTVVVTNSAGSVTSSAATLTVSGGATAPSITTQPASVTVTAGSAASFSVVATGTATLTYQWKKGGANIAGATSATYSIASTVAGDAGSYTVVVTNSAGSVTSSAATLTVNAAGGGGTAPTISTQPASQTVVTGHNVSFYGSATGNPTATYQWQVSTNSGSTWTDLSGTSPYSGTATNTLTITNATSTLNGYQYRFTATNTAGSVTSSAATLTVGTVVFPSPVAVVVDSAGTLWVSDNSANVIEKISGGTATVLAGTSGTQGSTNGTGAAALFRQPGGIAVDSAGNLYVADTGNSIIRKITSAGVVTTLAGSASSQGSTDGTGAAASFNAPAALTIDGSGNLYVADTGNSIIRKVTSSGVVTTFAGTAGSRGTTDGTGAAARFNQPAGIAVDSAGNLYVADTVNQTIRKITSAGAVTTWVGLAGVSGTSDGTGTNALFNQPSGLTRDAAGNLYVADTGNASIRVVTPSGTVSTLAGLSSISGFMDGSGTSAWFNMPKDVKYDGGSGLYVADSGNAAIRRVTLAGVVSTLVVTPGTSSSSSSSSSSSGGSSSGGSSSSSSGGESGDDHKSGGGGGAINPGFILALLAAGLLRFRRARA